MQKYKYICWIHTDAMNNRRTQWQKRRKTSLTKYIPLTIFVRFKRGYSRFACERELEIEHNCNILTLKLMAGNVESFSFFQPEVQGPLCWMMAFLLHLISIFSGPQFIRTPSSFGLEWLSLPHLVSNSTATQLARRAQLSCTIVRRPLDL